MRIVSKHYPKLIAGLLLGTAIGVTGSATAQETMPLRGPQIPIECWDPVTNALVLTRENFYLCEPYVSGLAVQQGQFPGRPDDTAQGQDLGQAPVIGDDDGDDSATVGGAAGGGTGAADPAPDQGVASVGEDGTTAGGTTNDNNDNGTDVSSSDDTNDDDVGNPGNEPSPDGDPVGPDSEVGGAGESPGGNDFGDEDSGASPDDGGQDGSTDSGSQAQAGGTSGDGDASADAGASASAGDNGNGSGRR